MITFKEIRWGNAFSYGIDNTIKLDSAPLTQIVGKNGHGKSSIALILEEVLYNQNSKKIKKADILNRYSSDKSYSIELDFNKDNSDYTIKTNRSSASTTIKLYKDGKDISSHTSTNTYKQIEGIIGFDHKTFSQIVYQSSVSSLEFLTATDTARKKFLIELLNLSIYTKASERFKELASDANKQVDAVQAKLSTVRAWLTKYEKEDLTLKELEEEPSAPSELVSKTTLLKHELTNIESTNRKIVQNNTYKQVLSKIVVDDPVPEKVDDSVLAGLKTKLANKDYQLKEGIALSKKCSGPTIKCPTCSQDMDNSTMFSLVEQFNVNKVGLEEDIVNIKAQIKTLDQSSKLSILPEKLF